MNFKVDSSLVRELRLKHTLEEFNYIDDNNKFLPNTTYKLSNNQNTFNWFFDNIDIIYYNAESKDVFAKTVEDFEKFMLVEKNLKKQYTNKEFIKKLYEFSINKNINKFKEENKDSIWFYKNMHLIFSSKNHVSISIQKEYIKYINTNEELIKRLNIFLNEENIDKFSIKDCNLKFVDGVNYAIWFYESFEKILELKTEESKKILNHYSMYRINDLIEEFLYEDYRKFYDINIKFSNKMSMLEFWLNNKNIILNSNNMICKSIKKDYLKYCEKFSEIDKYVNQDMKKITKKDEIKYFDLVEFYNESNNIKYIYNCQTIKIGNLEATEYFYQNIEEIFENKNNYLLYDAIKKQFCESLFYKSIDNTNNKCDFYEKLIEFYNEEALNKFSYGQGYCFKDNIKMFNWFYSNKIRIFSTDDYYCLKIVEQFLKFKNQEKSAEYIDAEFKNKISKK